MSFKIFKCFFWCVFGDMARVNYAALIPTIFSFVLSFHRCFIFNVHVNLDLVIKLHPKWTSLNQKLSTDLISSLVLAFSFGHSLIIHIILSLG